MRSNAGISLPLKGAGSLDEEINTDSISVPLRENEINDGNHVPDPRVSATLTHSGIPPNDMDTSRSLCHNPLTPGQILHEHSDSCVENHKDSQEYTPEDDFFEESTDTAIDTFNDFDVLEGEDDDQNQSESAENPLIRDFGESFQSQQATAQVRTTIISSFCLVIVSVIFFLFSR